MRGLPAALAEVARWIGEVLPDAEQCIDRAVPHGEAFVWEVQGRGVTLAWLKRHRNAGKAQREERAYTAWGGGDAFAPWLGRCPVDRRALLVGHVPGVPANAMPSDRTALEPVLEALGAALRRLHTQPWVDDDPMPIGEAMRARCAGWVMRADGVVDEDLLDAVGEMFLTPWAPELKRVPCHRDVHLGNVIVGPHGITLIDFGQSRPDLWLSDVVKLFPVPGGRDGWRWKAFSQGYGKRLATHEVDALWRLRALHGLATWVWAAEHGDRARVQEGREILQACADAWSAPG